MRTLAVGGQIPRVELREAVVGEFGVCPMPPKVVITDDVFNGKKVVVFAVPGAFTPTCSEKHLPSYLDNFKEFKALGVDDIYCISCNDAFVLSAWAQHLKVPQGTLRFLADGAALFAKESGLAQEPPGMGTRLKRFSALVENGKIRFLNVEEPKQYEVSDVKYLLGQMKGKV